MYGFNAFVVIISSKAAVGLLSCLCSRTARRAALYLTKIGEISMPLAYYTCRERAREEAVGDEKLLCVRAAVIWKRPPPRCCRVRVALSHTQSRGDIDFGICLQILRLCSLRTSSSPNKNFRVPALRQNAPRWEEITTTHTPRLQEFNFGECRKLRFDTNQTRGRFSYTNFEQFQEARIKLAFHSQSLHFNPS